MIHFTIGQGFCRADPRRSAGVSARPRACRMFGQGCGELLRL